MTNVHDQAVAYLQTDILRNIVLLKVTIQALTGIAQITQIKKLKNLCNPCLIFSKAE